MADERDENRGERWRKRGDGDGPAIALMILGGAMWWFGTPGGWVVWLGGVLLALGLIGLLARNVLMWRR